MVAGKLFRFLLYAVSGLALLWTLFASILHAYVLAAGTAVVLLASRELA